MGGAECHVSACALTLFRPVLSARPKVDTVDGGADSALCKADALVDHTGLAP